MKVAPAGGMSITGGEFKTAIEKLIQDYSIHNVIETGTYKGTGSTRIIAEALNKKGIEYNLFTMEANPEFANEAVDNLRPFPYVNVINGYSLPKYLLPTKEYVKNMLTELDKEDIYVDFQDHERLELYGSDNRYEVTYDNLQMVLRFFGWRADLIVLDSSGAMGWIEFQYVMQLLKGEAIIVLDDTNHVKHFKSLQHIKKNPKFQMIFESQEKFGFCIAKYRGGN